MNDDHDVCHMAHGVSAVQKVLCEAGFFVCTFKVTEIFLETVLKGLPVCPLYFMLHDGQVI
jgi:hypothetical protein